MGCVGASSANAGPVDSTSERSTPAGPTTVRDPDGTTGSDGVFPRRRLRRTVLAELVVALAVLAVTAALVNEVPARQAAGQPFTYSFSALGVQVDTIIDPARAGPANHVHVYVLSDVGTPRAVPELDLSLRLPARSIGPLPVHLVLGGPGHYYAADLVLPVTGDWVLTYTLRTDAVDERVVRTLLPVH